MLDEPIDGPTNSTHENFSVILVERILDQFEIIMIFLFLVKSKNYVDFCYSKILEEAD